MNAVLAAIALLILASAGIALTLRNIVRSVILLVVTWFGIAAFDLWAGAEFVAFAQVLVYVGAVSMVVLFAVLLTRRSRADMAVSPDTQSRAVSAVLAAGAVLAVLLYAVLLTPLPSGISQGPSANVRQIGTELMGTHAAALLVIGMILTVATLGGVVIASTDGASKKEGPK